MSKIKILLLANNWVGLKVAEYLVEQQETIVGLGIHPPHKQRFTEEILQTIKLPQGKIFDGSSLRQPDTLQTIKKLKPDIIIAAFWGVILKKELTDIAPLGCINFHPGLLPYNRGMNPNVWPFIEGTPSGVTIHYIDEGIDTGDIIAQREVPISELDTAGDIDKRTHGEMVTLFKDVWPKLKNKTAPRIPQDTTLATFHFAKDIEKVSFIDLERTYTGRELIQLLRSRSYGNRSFAYYYDNGKKISITAKLSGDENQEKEANEYQEYVEKILSDLKKGPLKDRKKTITVTRNGKTIASLTVIRKDQIEDKELIKDLAEWRNEHKEWFPTQFKVTQNGTKEWLQKKVIDTPDRILFLLTDIKGEAYGHMGLFRFNYYERSCEIDNVLRGRDLNPGSMKIALKHLIKWAYETFELKKLYLRVMADNPKAITLYKRCGFNEFERIPLHRREKEGMVEWVELPKIIPSPENKYMLRMILE